MDIYLSGAVPDLEEQAAVDSVLGPPQLDLAVEAHWCVPEEKQPISEEKSAQSRRHLLLSVLHAINSCVSWISPGALNYACQRLAIPPAEAFGVADFYGLFSMNPRPPVVIHVCDDLACLIQGAPIICEALKSRLGPPGSQGASGIVTWLQSSCLGLCDSAPAALILGAGVKPWKRQLAPTTAEDIMATVKGPQPQPEQKPGTTFLSHSTPQQGSPGLRLLKRIGKVAPDSIDDHIAQGGYQALHKSIDLGPEWVIGEVNESKLMGRGGAAFPTGRKWEQVSRIDSSRQIPYLVCNADESEPGTFKDRVIMEEDPFLLIESMTVAGLAIGSQQGYLYIRGEYPLAIERLSYAIDQARQRNFLGKQILGHDLKFDIEIQRGAGAYICGEETALFNSIEGYRGEPRNKPPYPTEVGLFGQPTVVNNVETLINIPGIVLQGGKEFASIGTPGSTGTKLFCLSGRVHQPGLYEVPFGINLRQIIELAGGVSGSGRLQAILLGGAAGTFLFPEELETPLTFEGTRAVGATLGSAVVMAFDDSIDLKKILLRIAAFFRDESCGQCVPCRVGTVRQEELLSHVFVDQPRELSEQESFQLSEIGQVMRDASICGLGHTAFNAIESVLARWKGLSKSK